MSTFWQIFKKWGTKYYVHTKSLCSVCKTSELETKEARSSGQKGEAAEPNSCPLPGNIAHLQDFVSRDLPTPTPPQWMGKLAERFVSRACFHIRQGQCRLCYSSKLSYYLPLGKWDKEGGSMSRESAQLVSSKLFVFCFVLCFFFNKTWCISFRRRWRQSLNLLVFIWALGRNGSAPFSFHILRSRHCKQQDPPWLDLWPHNLLEPKCNHTAYLRQVGMCTAQNYKQKRWSKLILFLGKNINLMDYCRSEKWAHKQMDSIVYRCFDLCGDKGWTVCPHLTLGDESEIKTENRNLKQE